MTGDSNDKEPVLSLYIWIQKLFRNQVILDDVTRCNQLSPKGNSSLGNYHLVESLLDAIVYGR